MAAKISHFFLYGILFPVDILQIDVLCLGQPKWAMHYQYANRTVLPLCLQMTRDQTHTNRWQIQKITANILLFEILSIHAVQKMSRVRMKNLFFFRLARAAPWGSTERHAKIWPKPWTKQLIPCLTSTPQTSCDCQQVKDIKRELV